MGFALLAFLAMPLSCSEMEKPDPEPPATRALSSGLIFTETLAGEGPVPAPNDRVRVHYHGTLSDGRVFDSSIERKDPAIFPLNRVIKCWSEGLQLMKVGGKARLECPPRIAYGTRGIPSRIPPNATLFFDVELIGIE
jgi:FKBP-type peptidyl-prolyl cis-trans isomerase FkpA